MKGNNRFPARKPMNHNTDHHREHTERCNSGVLFLAGKQRVSSCTVGSHPLSKKCLFTENGDHYRNSQLDKFRDQQVMGTPAPMDASTTQLS